MTHNIVSEYFKKMDTLPNIYAGLEAVEGGLDPDQRLYQMMLKRLHGYRIEFTPVYIRGYGNLDIPPIDRFDLRDLVGSLNTHDVSTVPDHLYTSEFEVRDAWVKIDWYCQTLLVRFKEGVLEDIDEELFLDVDHGVYVESIDLVKPLRVSPRDVEGRTTISLSLFTNSSPESDFRHSRDGMYVHHNRIEYGSVVFDGAYDILPERPIKLSDVSQITGVSASTLSELRHGKKKIENLSVATATLLTRYGEIRYLDRFILDNLMKSYDDEATNTTVTQNDGRDRYTARFVLRDGCEYVTVHTERLNAEKELFRLQKAADFPFVLLRGAYKKGVDGQRDTMLNIQDIVVADISVQTKTEVFD